MPTFPKNLYGFIALTGGGQGALDKIDGADLKDQDYAFGVVDGKVHQYWLDIDSGAAENSPYVIAPDTNAGNKRWILASINKLTGDLDAGGHSINNLLGLGFKTATELTISGGAITVTQSIHTVDTEGDAGSDDLDTINGGATVQLIILRAANDARTVVVKHNTGNIWLKGKADLSLDDLEDGLALFWDGTKWIDLGAGGGGCNLTAFECTQLQNIDDSPFTVAQWQILSAVSDPLIGVEWNQNTDTWKWIDEDGDELILNPSTAYFDSHAIWGGMRRCTLADNGTVNHYGSNARGDGLTLDGTDGQVMVEIPKFYVKTAKPSANKYRWWISPTAKTGFEVHPAFKQRGGTERDYIYIGAYEAYNDGGSPNKLMSRTGIAPTVSTTIGNFRTYAENRGSTRWGITSIWALSAVRLLFYIEYAGADSQTLIGRGIVDEGAKKNTGADSADTNIATNGTGTGTGSDGHTPIIYRGIENLWGNVWQFIDGYNVINSEYQVAKKDGTNTYQDDMDSGQTPLSSSEAPITSDGYIDNILWETDFELLLIPNSVGGASNSHLYDYFWAHDAGETNILLFSGRWDDAVKAGVTCLHSEAVASYFASSLGARLEFI